MALGAGLAVGNLFSADEKSPFKDQKEKVSYSIGANIGSNFKEQSIDVDVDVLARGMRDALAGKALLDKAQLQETLTAFQQQLRGVQEQKRKEQADKNKKEGDAFLTDNKKKEGVITLPSGLQYKVIKPGAGDLPKATDTVTTHYRGTLLDGTEFDSSLKKNEPQTFPVTGVIKGWQEALQLMKAGSKWQLFIPGELAYGERGRPGIPPNATLIFEIELISIKPPTPQASANPPVTSDIIKVPSAEELKKGAKIEVIKADQAKELEKQAATNKPPATKPPEKK